MVSKESSAIPGSTNIKNYNGIDIVKFLCAVMVAAIHIPILSPPVGGELSHVGTSINTAFQQAICRMAVPFYFICSGFFLFRKMPSGVLDIKQIKDYCFKLIRLFGLWSIVLFWGGSGHLWYLGATVVAVVVLSLCLHYRLDLKWLTLIGCAFYALGLLGDSYSGLIRPFFRSGMLMYIYAAYKFVVPYSRNGFFTGYIFVFMGYLFAQGKFRLKASQSLTGFFISMTGLCAEAYLLVRYDIPSDYNMYLFLLPVAFFLFAFASSLALEDRPIYAKLRTVGVLIYFLHLFVNTGIWAVKKALYKVFSLDIQPICFFVSLSVTILVALGLEWLSHKEKFKWIRWFWS